jgi:hypothetical protein
MSISTIFQLYRGGQFYWLRKPQKWSENFAQTALNCFYKLNFALSGLNSNINIIK